MSGLTGFTLELDGPELELRQVLQAVQQAMMQIGRENELSASPHWRPFHLVPTYQSHNMKGKFSVRHQI